MRLLREYDRHALATCFECAVKIEQHADAGRINYRTSVRSSTSPSASFSTPLQDLERKLARRREIHIAHDRTDAQVALIEEAQ